MESENTIHLPEEIKKAVLSGYDIYITKAVRDGEIYAKVTFHRVKTAGKERLGKVEEQKP